MIYSRTLAGLRIESDIALPDLAALNGYSPEFGMVRIRVVSKELLTRVRKKSADFGGILFRSREIGECFVTGPREMMVAPVARADEREVVPFLLGPCFAAIAYMNGVLPLHAAAIDTPLGCVAFAGNSGAGKSTLVHALMRQGYPVRSDDVCFIRVAPDGQIMVWPGIRRLRLVPADPRYGDPEKKRRLALPPLRQPAQPVRLRAIYRLDVAPHAENEEITGFCGARAAEQVIASAYRIGIAARLGQVARAVPVCVKVADSVPVYRFRRVIGLDSFPQSLGRLQEHFSGSRPLLSRLNTRCGGTDTSPDYRLMNL